MGPAVFLKFLPTNRYVRGSQEERSGHGVQVLVRLTPGVDTRGLVEGFAWVIWTFPFSWPTAQHA